MSFKASGPQTRPERVKPAPVPSPSRSRSRSSSTASTTSFTSAVEDQDGEPKLSAPVRFSREEEAQMVEASHRLKNAANKQFTTKDYSSAISTYDKALAELPIYLDYELAVLQSNVAACHLQLQEWKEAIEFVEKGLDCLEREMPMPKAKKVKEEEKDTTGRVEKQEQEDSKVVELPEGNDDEANVEMLKKLDISDQRKTDIHRIRTKLLLRRARAKVKITEQPASTSGGPKTASFPDRDRDNSTTTAAELPKPKPPDAFSPGSTWGNLSTALSDYQTLAQPTYFHHLPQADQKTVIDMLRTLPKKVEEAKEKEVGEMMGKLKELGNGILKPFGLSTDMFNMVQDPGTGGWSMNFGGKAAGKK